MTGIRRLAVVLLLATGVVPSPALASSLQHVFQAPYPCAAACPLVLEGPEAACAPEPASVPGSWDEIRVRALVPIAYFELWPSVDYDLFVCRVTPAADGSYLVGYSANPVGHDCGHHVRPWFVACEEYLSVAVEPGEILRFRVYNFADVGPAVGRASGVERA